MSRTIGGTRAMMSAFEAADTLATVTLDLGRPVSDHPRPAAPVRSAPRPGPPPARYGPPPARTGTGRHAKVPPAPASDRLADRAVLLLHRHRLPVLAAVTVLVSGLVAGGLIIGNQSPARRCALPYSGQQDSDVCADLHNTVAIDDRTVSATPLGAAGSALSLCSTVRLTNVSGDTQRYRAADFTIQAPSGAADPPTSGTLAASGTLAPGATASGTVCDDQAVWSGQYVLVYRPGDDDGGQRGVWLTQH